MARAQFAGGGSLRGYEGWATVRVEAELPEPERPFSGPPHRNFHGFDGSGWEWRSRCDRARQLARAVLDGKMTPEEAEARWPSTYLPSDIAYEMQDEDETEEEALRSIFLCFADGELVNTIYREDGDDSLMSDARDALDLPPWARAVDAGDGGPGSGFTAAYIVIEPPRGFEDLVAWLRMRERGEA